MRLIAITGTTERSDPRSELSALHRRLYRRQRRLIAATLGPESTEFRRYRQRYQTAVRDFEAIVPYEHVVAAAASAPLVLIGDYHTLRQAQRSVHKLAERLLDRGVPVLLALEFVQGRFQPAVDAYLAGLLGEQAFLEAIHYQQLQPFDLWPNFKPLLELARRHHLPVIAIDSPSGGPGSLRARDQYAAQTLALTLRSHPRRTAIALMGQLHLAPDHLPRALPPWARAKALTIYQNCEEIYFELERRGEEQSAEAVRLGPQTFCLINSSPIVAQQSYLDWVEATALGERVDAVTPEVHFREAGQLVATFLEISPPQSLADVEVASPGNLALLRRLHRGDAREFRLLTRRILGGASFCLPSQHAVYIDGSSLNRAAEVAARYLWHLCADEDGETRGLVDAFYAATLEETLGFFGSKIVNPRRKAQHRPQLISRLDRPGGGLLDREIAAAVLAHQRFERGERVPEVQRLYTLRNPDHFHAVTRAVGQVLGDKLYYALLRNRIGKAEVRSLFFDPFDDEGAALHTYLYLVGKVGRTRIPVRSA